MTTEDRLIGVLDNVDLKEFDETLSTILEDANKQDSDWREGQYVFNLLYQHYPEVADAIRGTELDMFYVDARIEDFVRIIDNYIYKHGN